MKYTGPNGSERVLNSRSAVFSRKFSARLNSLITSLNVNRTRRLLDEFRELSHIKGDLTRRQRERMRSISYKLGLPTTGHISSKRQEELVKSLIERIQAERSK